MSDLLLFYPRGSKLVIEFLGARYIQRQPKTPEDANIFMNEVRPIIEQLDEYVAKNGLKEIIELNLKDVPLSKLNADTAIHLIQLMSEIRPEKGLLEKICITHSNPIFNMIYRGAKGRLPARVRDIVEIVADTKFF